MSRTQNEKLLAELAKRRRMTALEIWQELGIARASARVFDLRRSGHAIHSKEVVVPNRDGQPCRVAEYELRDEQMTLIPNHPGRGAMHHG